MSHASYFGPAFKPKVVRSSSPVNSKKRKRDLTPMQDESDAQLSEISSSTVLKGGSLSQDVTIQCRISGQPIDTIPPAGKFPHVSPDHCEGSPLLDAQRNLASELANTRPPLRVAAKNGLKDATNRTSTVGLRQRHAASLITVVHKSLLNGDYVRAGRAWGAMLRTEHGGHSFDLRNHDRWSLGAECLLKRQAQYVGANGEAVADPGNPLKKFQHNQIGGCYNRQDIEQAKDYYERLALQYPYRKAFPRATGPQQFYLAMFGLWIYSIKEQHSLSMSINENSSEMAGEGDPTGMQQSYGQSGSTPELPRHENIEAIRQDTSRHAHRIVERLEELLNSPPYSDDERFWELLGMIELWIGDLSAIDPLQKGSENGNKSPRSEESNISSGLDSQNVVNPSRSTRQGKRDDAFTKARKAFEKAKLCSTGAI